MAKERVTRKLAAIFAADMVGYSRLMENDEEGTIARQRAHRAELIDPNIAEHGGRIVKSTGDGLLVEFASAVDAVRCAAEIQLAMADREANVPEDRRIAYRVGINIGDIVIDDEDILGDGVNIAARLEAMAGPGGVCVSGNVYEHVARKLDFAFGDMGDQKVKNIERPVRAYRVQLDGADQKNWGDAASRAPSLELPDKPSIAVLPFEDLSADKDQEYFADGIAEDIITALSRNRGVFVIARNSSFTYKGAAVDVKRVSQELGVRYVLEGSVRKAGSRVRITAQLIDAASGNHVWAERYDRELEDIFAVQDEITQNIVAALGPELASAEMQRARRKDPGSLDAWDCTMRAMWHFARHTIEDLEEARRLALRAIELDSTAASAYSVIALTHVRDAVNGWSESAQQSILKAYEAARKAVALDDRDANAHWALGFAGLYQRRFEDAVNSLETAIDLDPNNAFAHGGLSGVLALAGRGDEAVEQFATAMRLSPRDPLRYWWLLWRGHVEFAEEKYDEAANWARKSLQINPDFPAGLRLLAASYGKLGRIEEADAALDRLSHVVPELTVEIVRSQVPLTRSEDMERYLDGLRKAGLPES